jgi:hypothetical protein
MSDFPVETRRNRGSIFLVDEVVRAERPLWTEPLHEHVAKRFLRKVLLLPEAEKPVANSLCDSVLLKVQPEKARRDVSKTVNRCHPLIDAVSTAFAQHRPLTLSPDCIWLVIEQGFAHHLAENAEALRHRLVRHEGKRELTAKFSEMSLAGFQGAISSFSTQIREASDPVLHETLVCDFSTTTPLIRTASEVVLMDCYSSYFHYSMEFVCGIPKITITGSLDDWQRIRARIEVLETYRLGWWVARLRPILDEFLRTVEGEPNVEFWQAICKPKQAYGAEAITGWIADLFPYLNDAPERRRNHILQYERADWAVPIEKGVKTFGIGEPGADKGVAAKSFPSGLASVPVNLKFPGGSTNMVDLVAGFLGIEQDSEDLALTPVISWSVVEPAPAKPVWV